MDNPYNNPETGREVYVKPVPVKNVQDEAWERLKQILEADPELMDVFNRMKDK